MSTISMPATSEGAPLNPNHSHFLLVDDGTEGQEAWQSEIRTRNAIESFITSFLRIPIVQLAVQGGVGTLATMIRAGMDATPIVVLADSGGAATAIAKYLQFGLGAVEPQFQVHADKLEQALSSSLSPVMFERVLLPPCDA